MLQGLGSSELPVWFLLSAASATLCFAGTWVGIRGFGRARASRGLSHIGWLFKAAVATGATLWASSRLSLLAIASDMPSVFDPAPAALALLVAIVVCMLAFAVASWQRPWIATEVGGALLGLGMAVVQFLALASWHTRATITVSNQSVAVLTAIAVVFGVLAMNRANRPMTRWCRHGAAVALTMAIVALQWATQMAISVKPDPFIMLSPEHVTSTMAALSAICCSLIATGLGASAYLIDLHVRTEAAERIHQLSFNDSMTGLPNRIAFNERLAFAVAQAHGEGTHLAVLAIDLDGFRGINEGFGHAAGDHILIEVASRLRAAMKPGEFIARHNGDEFLVLQASRDQPRDGTALAERIVNALAQEFTVADQSVKIGASVGVAVYPQDTLERDNLLTLAKLAMQRAKESHRGSHCRFDRSMDEQSRRRRALARDLQTILNRDELELHYQIQTCLGDARVIGAEALLRWRHPKLGMISPVEFIPIAEECGAIVDIGEWTLRTACRDAAAGRIPGVVAVNLSPVQFGFADLAETIHGILVETGLSPHRLEVEVTESTLMADQTRSLHILRKLKSMGITIAMDDFGTGYSSLATLHAFPFDRIKLDRSFVARIPGDKPAAAIVRTVIALGRSLAIPVLAEGIETDAQWQFLSAEGCGSGQGYLIGKPVPLAQLAGVLADWEARAPAPSERPKFGGAKAAQAVAAA